MASILTSCFAPPSLAIASNTSLNPFLEDDQILQNVLQDLKHTREALLLKSTAVEDLQRDIQFHQIKNQELTDVLNALQCKTNGDDQQQQQIIMTTKAEQNAELIMQVQELCDLLNTSTETMDNLRKDCEMAVEERETLLSEHKSHQLVMTQVHSLYRTVEKMPVPTTFDKLESEWFNKQWMASPAENDSNMVQFISRKVIVLEADRQRLLQESQSHQQEYLEQEERILVLERQVKSLQEEKAGIQDSKHALQKELDVRAGQIEALQELFQTINTYRTMDDIPKSVEYTTEEEKIESMSLMGDMNEEEEQHLDDQGEQLPVDQHQVETDDVVSVDIVSQAANKMGATVASLLNCLHIDLQSLVGPREDINSLAAVPSATKDDVPSFHPKDVELELQQAAMQEAQTWKDMYESQKSDYNASQLKIANLSVQVQDLEQQVNHAKLKEEIRVGLLKDAIQQFKNLAKEHEGANQKITKLKDKVARLILKQYKQDKAMKAALCPSKGKELSPGETTERLPGENKKEYYPGKTRSGGDIECSDPHSFLHLRIGTFETETSGVTMETELQNPENDFTSYSYSSVNDEEDAEDKVLLEDYRRLEVECDRLQHEFEKAVAKISTLEGQVEKAHSDVRAYQKEQADQKHAVAMLVTEKARLQEELLEEKQKLAERRATQEDQHNDELRMAELRAEQARSKQREREKDLWDVIEQYKELAERNAEQQEHMNDVERELQLTHRVHIQRRDLVYEYRKMERALEEAMDTVSQLEKDLKQAKADAARNKEEARSVRKRLSGCHFHYKQLQEQYDACLRQKDDLHRQVTKAEKHENLRQTQAKSWKSQFYQLRDEFRESQEQIKRLTLEKPELQTYREDLLNLTAEVTIAT